MNARADGEKSEEDEKCKTRVSCKLPFVVAHPRKQYVTYICGGSRIRVCLSRVIPGYPAGGDSETSLTFTSTPLIVTIHRHPCEHPAEDSAENFEF